mmetsp:Transcript_129790/g.416462  ORF Transcript_129790/g.416462 Transcript_129790/m.416462 type:complete len:234 (+) Transcript_129790:430-1131(+)
MVRILRRRTENSLLGEIQKCDLEALLGSFLLAGAGQMREQLLQLCCSFSLGVLSSRVQNVPGLMHLAKHTLQATQVAIALSGSAVHSVAQDDAVLGEVADASLGILNRIGHARQELIDVPVDEHVAETIDLAIVGRDAINPHTQRVARGTQPADERALCPHASIRVENNGLQGAGGQRHLGVVTGAGAELPLDVGEVVVHRDDVLAFLEKLRDEVALGHDPRDTHDDADVRPS